MKNSKLDLGFLLVVGACALVVVGVFARFALTAVEIADDFHYMNTYNAVLNPVTFAKNHYLGHNGRVGQAFFFAVSYELLGRYVVTILPLLFLLGLIALVTGLLHRVVAYRRHGLLASMIASIFLVTSGLVLSPSIMDSYLWLTSSSVYLGGLMFTLLPYYLYAVFRSSPRAMFFRALVLFVLAVWAGPFSEPLTIVAGVTGFLFAIIGVCRRRKADIVYPLALWLGHIVGFGVVYVSPGTRVRRQFFGTKFDLVAILGETPKELNILSALGQEWGFALAAAAALVVVACAAQKMTGVRAGLAALAFGAFVFLNVVVFHIAVSKTGIPVVALRTFTIPAYGYAATAFLVCVAVGLLLRGLLPERVAAPASFIGALALLLVFAGDFLGYSAAVQSALDIRKDGFEQRVAEVTVQRDSHPATEPIFFTPLPTPLVSQAIDLSLPGVPMEDWVITGMARWHGVEPPSRLHVGDLPEGYCVPAHPTINPEFAC